MERGNVKTRNKMIFETTNYEGIEEKIRDTLEKANTKKLGRVIKKEDLLFKLLEKIDDQLIFELQRESITPDEIDSILKKQLLKEYSPN